MAAASLFLSSLGLWHPKPNQIKHSARFNIRRRQRITPPLSEDEVVKRQQAERELEIIQERHIRRKIQEYILPFKLFLGAIGRFPYKVVDQSIQDHSKKRDIFKAIKKASCAPILELGVIQEQEAVDQDMEGPIYVNDYKSAPGIAFIITTFISLIILGIAGIGYIDLRLTELQFRDVIQKEVNGDLNCIGGWNKTIQENLEGPVIQMLHGHGPQKNKVFEEITFKWNCSHAAKVLSACHTHPKPAPNSSK